MDSSVGHALIEANFDSVRRSAEGGVTGVVLLRLDDTAFPGEGWSDFPVVVLGWWLRTFTRLLSGAGTSGRCHFMDGPFGFEVRRERDDEWFVTQLRDNRSGSARPIDGPALVDSAVACARAILNTCAQRGWHSADVDELRAAMEAVESYRRA